MGPTKLGRIGLSLFFGAVLGFGLLVWGNGTQAQSPEPIRPDLTDQALAEALGLEITSGWYAGCVHYVEVEESGAGYCLDRAVTTNVEAWDVGQRLRGHVPSALERQVFELEDQLAQAAEAGDTARVEELSAEIAPLWEELNRVEDGGE